MPIPSERLDAEGVDSEVRRRRHMDKVLAIRLGPRVPLRTWDEARAICIRSPIDAVDFEKHGEDVVKQAVRLALEADGWEVSVRWGQEQGTDIVAERGGEVLVAEAKGMRESQAGFWNSTLKAIGQVAMAREEPAWKCALAFPAHREYVRLSSKLSDWYRSAMSLTVFLVKKDGGAYAVASLGPPEAP